MRLCTECTSFARGHAFAFGRTPFKSPSAAGQAAGPPVLHARLAPSRALVLGVQNRGELHVALVGSISAEAERSSSMETPNCQLFRDTVNSEVPSRPSKARQPRYNSSHDPKLPLLVTATNGVFRVRACLCVRLASYYWIPTAVATTKNMVSRKNGQFKLFSFLFLVAVLYHCVSIGRCCCSLGTTEAVPNRLVW